MNYFYSLTLFILISLSSKAQTTVCLIRGDTVFAGGTDRSCIKSAGKFNFIFNGPIDTAVIEKINKIASVSKDFNAFSTASSLAVKELYTDYFSYILKKDPAFFDQKIMKGQISIGIGNTCLFGIENNKPVLISVVFQMNKGVRHPVVVSYSVHQQPIAIFSSGSPHKHKGIVGSLPDRGPVGEIKRMIGIDTDGLVDGTGPPIDVLVVTRDGRKWIRK